MKTLYRNKKILDLANEIPECTGCGNHNHDNVVAAHSNQLRDGKGRGIKSHDFRVAYLCDTCHYNLDQGARMSREERKQLWEESHRKTIEWLFTSGHVKII